MGRLIKFPHEVHESTCYVNGLFDILKWKGAEYDYYLLPVAGGMASFAYLKFKLAKPPCMVYWGTAPKYLLQELSETIGLKQTTSEGKSFKNEFPKMKKYLDSGQPVMAGALDMYYLHYYPDLYQKVHVPIHYVLLVGYDDDKQKVYLHDCTWQGIQEVPYKEFEQALAVNVPGLSRKNTYRVFQTPGKFISELELAEKGFARKAQRMLHPPVALLGIPAMRKLAKDIPEWDGNDCYEHMVAYAGLIPPLIAADLSHNDGMRFEQARVLRELSEKYDRPKWAEAAALFVESGKLIIELCQQAVKYDGKACSVTLSEIAETEQQAYGMLS